MSSERSRTLNKYVILVTGASSGFGRLTAEALAVAGHTVYDSMRETEGRNADQVHEIARFAAEYAVALRAIELDVGSDASVAAAVAAIIADHGRLDVVMHNAGHMVYGPKEALTPERLADLYDRPALVARRWAPHRQKG